MKRQLVLVAIDHATDVERTMDLALCSAKARGANVHVIQVVPHSAGPVDDAPAPWPFEPQDGPDADIRERLVASLRSSEPDEVPVYSITLRGEPERVIPAYAQLHQATLLAVERDYGSSRFWRRTRVVEELARQSPMPLLVLPTRHERERGGHALRRIVTPVDFSIASAVALRTAVDLSRRHGARITLVHALGDVSSHMVFSGSEAGEAIRRLPARREAAAERLRRKAALFGAEDVDTEVVTGVADSAILETAARSDATGASLPLTSSTRTAPSSSASMEDGPGRGLHRAAARKRRGRHRKRTSSATTERLARRIIAATRCPDYLAWTRRGLRDILDLSWATDATNLTAGGLASFRWCAVRALGVL